MENGKIQQYNMKNIDNNKLEFSIEDSYIPSLLHDDTGQIVDVNNMTCEITGYSKNELYQMNIKDIEHDIFEHINPEQILSLNPDQSLQELHGILTTHTENDEKIYFTKKTLLNR